MPWLRALLELESEFQKANLFQFTAKALSGGAQNCKWQHNLIHLSLPWFGLEIGSKYNSKSFTTQDIEHWNPEMTSPWLKCWKLYCNFCELSLKLRNSNESEPRPMQHQLNSVSSMLWGIFLANINNNCRYLLILLWEKAGQKVLANIDRQLLWKFSVNEYECSHRSEYGKYEISIRIYLDSQTNIGKNIQICY